jgi:hypothetical protein
LITYAWESPVPLAERAEAEPDGLATQVAKGASQRDQAEAVGGGFAFNMCGRSGAGGQGLGEPAGGFLALVAGRTKRAVALRSDGPPNSRPLASAKRPRPELRQQLR